MCDRKNQGFVFYPLIVGLPCLIWAVEMFEQQIEEAVPEIDYFHLLYQGVVQYALHFQS